MDEDRFYDRLADEYEEPRPTADECKEKYTEDCEDSWDN
ncbi:hypothetical protein NBRC111893_2384 [Lentilactobacillus kosonis]|uniref:Uncharacterized protein n=1 Tax=Lentilactobacillus kosonis TaxID=2810561 RepID=A0A401FPP1_9LACO|nr:hypothetical protein NBRC111893_2384 [Lentilactobacillus kosonis]